MSKILRADGSFVEGDSWRVLREPNGKVAAGDVVPLATYLALEHGTRAGIAVWLAPSDEPRALAEHAAPLPLIAVDFPVFRDGRGFSIATLLRTRYGFAGDLRAIGDVLVDQLFYLKRVGFSSFALRADQDPAVAQAALRTFSDVYQRAVDQPLPLFKRRFGLGAQP
jgi:uncharacterized protein (DUF934 family)